MYLLFITKHNEKGFKNHKHEKKRIKNHYTQRVTYIHNTQIKHKVLMQQLLRSEGVYGLVVVDIRWASLACLFLLVIGYLNV